MEAVQIFSADWKPLVLPQVRTAFTNLELCHKIKVQARVKVKVPPYGAKLATFCANYEMLC